MAGTFVIATATANTGSFPWKWDRKLEALNNGKTSKPVWTRSRLRQIYFTACFGSGSSLGNHGRDLVRAANGWPISSFEETEDVFSGHGETPVRMRAAEGRPDRDGFA